MIIKLPEEYATEFCEDMDEKSHTALCDLFAQCQRETREAVMQEYGILNAEDSRALLDSLQNPKPPTDALKRALRRGHAAAEPEAPMHYEGYAGCPRCQTNAHNQFECEAKPEAPKVDFVTAIRNIRAKLAESGQSFDSSDFFCEHGRLKTRDCDKCDAGGSP